MTELRAIYGFISALHPDVYARAFGCFLASEGNDLGVTETPPSLLKYKCSLNAELATYLLLTGQVVDMGWCSSGDEPGESEEAIGLEKAGRL